MNPDNIVFITLFYLQYCDTCPCGDTYLVPVTRIHLYYLLCQYNIVFITLFYL